MSLSDAKLPSLKDKLEAQVVRVQEKGEKKDEESKKGKGQKKAIKKSAKQK